ncbi:MAG: hypothetical protein HYU39_05010 [Thaumarchaeota archaeon]|nr:hypothetical protein [Nitrososphaerota archaeon]
MKTLILSMDDTKILVTIKECIDLQEKAFRALGMSKTISIPSSWLELDKYKGSLKVMGSYVETEDGEYAIVKSSNSFDLNNELHNLPTTVGFITLVDPKTGLPLCFMDGEYITALRTGAGGALAARFLAKKNPQKICVIGSGTTAGFTFRAILEAFRSVREARVYSINRKQGENLCRKLSTQYNVEVKQTSSSKEAVEEADILISGTNSTTPVLTDRMVEAGMHISAMGRRTEVDPNVFRRCKVVADSIPNAVSGGKCFYAISKGTITEKDVYGDLGELVVGKKQGRITDQEITLFDSSGVGVQDVVVAGYVYEKALKKNLGTEVDLLKGVEEMRGY